MQLCANWSLIFLITRTPKSLNLWDSSLISPCSRLWTCLTSKTIIWCKTATTSYPKTSCVTKDNKLIARMSKKGFQTSSIPFSRGKVLVKWSICLKFYHSRTLVHCSFGVLLKSLLVIMWGSIGQARWLHSMSLDWRCPHLNFSRLSSSMRVAKLHVDSLMKLVWPWRCKRT